jgi:hypothetical protein
MKHEGYLHVWPRASGGGFCVSFKHLPGDICAARCRPVEFSSGPALVKFLTALGLHDQSELKGLADGRTVICGAVLLSDEQHLAFARPSGDGTDPSRT